MPAVTVQLAEKEGGAALLKKFSKVAAIIVTNQRAQKLFDLMQEDEPEFAAGVWTSEEVRQFGSSLVDDLMDGTERLVWITKNGEDVGALVSPSLIERLLTACPGLKRNFDWSVVWAQVTSRSVK
jgi:hypothetical protein